MVKEYKIDYNLLLNVKELYFYSLDDSTLLSNGITIGSDEKDNEVYVEIEIWTDENNEIQIVEVSEHFAENINESLPTHIYNYLKELALKELKEIVA